MICLQHLAPGRFASAGFGRGTAARPPTCSYEMLNPMQDEEDSPERHRLDRWLWFTRFFKTRSLATQSVSLGRVTLNGARVRPAHAVQVGDRIAISRDGETWDIVVRDLPQRRGPAPEAQACYAETEESEARRVAARERRKLAEISHPRTLGRPDKRDRRQIDKLRRRQGD